jgi:hypothetical protein
MMTSKDINQKAIDSYHKCFKEKEFIVTPKSDDVILDKNKICEEIEELKIEEIQNHKSLELLRQQINNQAKDSLNKTFIQKEERVSCKKLNTKEMYEKLNEEKDRITHMTRDMIEAKMNENRV